MKKIITGFGLYYLAIGLFVLFAPIYFYQNTPGVSMMGPYNPHFIRDVSFAFMTSGVALLLGAFQANKSTVIVGALWPLMHALFHITIWVKREFVLDLVTASDFFAVIIPGVLVTLVAVRFYRSSHV